VSGLVNVLGPLSPPELERVCCRDELRIDDVLSETGLLSIGAALGDGQVGSISGALIVRLIGQRLYSRFASQVRRPVLIVIDEVARIVSRVELEELLAICAGAGATVALTLQDFSQLINDKDRGAVLTNCPTLVMLPGCSPEAAKLFSARLGERPEVQVARDAHPNLWHAGRSRRHAMVPVLGEREIMSPPRLVPAMHGSTDARRPAWVQAQQVSAKPILVDLTRQDLVL
jgi:type IV secretory pathway TraG/TraD family ATPase VirD4